MHNFSGVNEITYNRYDCGGLKGVLLVTKAVVICDNCKKHVEAQVVKEGLMLYVKLPAGWITDPVLGIVKWTPNNDEQLKQELGLDDDKLLAKPPDRHFCSQACLSEYRLKTGHQSTG